PLTAHRRQELHEQRPVHRFAFLVGEHALESGGPLLGRPGSGGGFDHAGSRGHVAPELGELSDQGVGVLRREGGGRLPHQIVRRRLAASGRGLGQAGAGAGRFLGGGGGGTAGPAHVGRNGDQLVEIGGPVLGGVTLLLVLVVL